MAEPKRLSTEKRKLTQKAIQKAAQQVFFEKGYVNSTISEIAKLAGVAKGSIYLHFQTKDDLYLSLMLPMLQEIRKSLTELKDTLSQTKQLSGKDFIAGFYNHYRRIYSFDPDGIRIIQAFQLGDLISAMSKEKQEELTAVARENFQLSRSVFAMAIQRKAIRQFNTMELVDIFWSTFIGIIQLEESKLRLTGKNHFEETLRSAFTLLANGLARS